MPVKLVVGNYYLGASGQVYKVTEKVDESHWRAAVFVDGVLSALKNPMYDWIYSHYFTKDLGSNEQVVRSLYVKE